MRGKSRDGAGSRRSLRRRMPQMHVHELYPVDLAAAEEKLLHTVERQPEFKDVLVSRLETPGAIWPNG